MNVSRTFQLSFRLRSFFFKTLLRSYKDIPIESIPDVSPSSIKKLLVDKGLTMEEGYTCFITKCVMCKGNKLNTKGGPKLYINKTTGMYMCSGCNLTGQWDQLIAHLNLSKSKKSKAKEKSKDDPSPFDVIKESLERIRQTTSEVKLLQDEEFANILDRFKLPKIEKESLSSLDLRINAKHTWMYFPLENCDNDIVGYRCLSSYKREESLTPNIQCGGLLTMRSIRSRDTAVLVPSLSDFLVLADAKLSASIVCLPDGVKTLSQYVLPSFERFKKIILWTGNDHQVWESTRHFAKKLGEKRCYLIRPSELLPSLKQDQDFKSIIGKAEPIWHKSITTFSALRDDVLSDLQNIDKVQGVKWKRYPILNKFLKGHRRGELTVITGPTGSGKTTFISEYSLDLAMQGVNTLWGSFEIRNVRLARTMLQQMAGLPLEENLALFDTLANEFEKLPIYFMTFHGEQSIKVVMEAVEHATYVHDISHLIIDNVQFMMGMSESQKHVDRFWKQDAIVAAFRTFATCRNCHVTLVMHPRKEREDTDLTTSSIFGGAKASQEADNVLLIQDKRLTSLKGKKYLQIAKNRYSGDLGVMPLEFDKGALSFSQKKPKDKQKPLRKEDRDVDSVKVSKETNENET